MDNCSLVDLVFCYLKNNLRESCCSCQCGLTEKWASWLFSRIFLRSRVPLQEKYNFAINHFTKFLHNNFKVLTNILFSFAASKYISSVIITNFRGTKTKIEKKKIIIILTVITKKGNSHKQAQTTQTNSKRSQTTSIRLKTTNKQPKPTSKQLKITSKQPKTTSKQPQTTSKQPKTTSKRLQTTSKPPQTTNKRP